MTQNNHEPPSWVYPALFGLVIAYVLAVILIGALAE